MEIIALLVSPTHAFEGRPQDGPRPDPVPAERDHVEVRAGLGLVGDRYFDHRAHRNAAVTLFAAESLDALHLAQPVDPHAVRRNIVLRGFPVDELVGQEFTLDGIRFQGHRPANPCKWMDVVVAPGAFRGLRGHGGVRCVPLTTACSGWARRCWKHRRRNACWPRHEHTPVAVRGPRPDRAQPHLGIADVPVLRHRWRARRLAFRASRTVRDGARGARAW
ncbi:hypothetical protein GCM10018954_100310 [Kutzneria kofuensis]